MAHPRRLPPLLAQGLAPSQIWRLSFSFGFYITGKQAHYYLCREVAVADPDPIILTELRRANPALSAHFRLIFTFYSR